MSVHLLLSLFLGLAAAQALAHSEAGDDPSGLGLVDCEHPAANMATRLPGEVAEPARIQCTPAMQSIVASESWTWRYPGSFFDRPFIPAYAPEASRGQGGARFFTGFSTRELPPDEVRSQHERFAREVATYREAAAPARIVHLVATNDLGHAMDAWFGFRADNEGWVVLCTPACEPGNLFLMQKAE